MTPRPVDTDQQAVKRQQIVEAAAAIFAEYGYDKASNRAIADRAGISPGLIYWYFDNKEALFMAVLEHLSPFNRMELLHAPLPLDQPLNTVLERIANHFIDVMSQDSTIELISLGLNEMLRFPLMSQFVGNAVSGRIISQFEHHLDARVEAGEINPINTHLAAQAFFGSLISFILRKHILNSEDLQSVTSDEMARVTTSIFAAGLQHSQTV